MSPEQNQEMYCLGCGYNLRGLYQPVCPECSRTYDPADPDSFSADGRPWRSGRRFLVLAVLGTAALIVVIAIDDVMLGAYGRRLLAIIRGVFYASAALEAGVLAVGVVALVRKRFRYSDGLYYGVILAGVVLALVMLEKCA